MKVCSVAGYKRMHTSRYGGTHERFAIRVRIVKGTIGGGVKYGSTAFFAT